MKPAKTNVGRVAEAALSGVLFVVLANGAAAQDRDPSLQSPGYLWKALLSSGSDPVASEEEQAQKWYDRTSVGAGIKTAFRSAENGAGSNEWSKLFQVNDARVYLKGSITDVIAATLNFEVAGGGAVIDAFAQFNFMPELHIWFGQLLPPSDRSNLDGPYYILAWDFPFVETYPTTGFGRQHGIEFWGELSKSMVKYYVGLFDGIPVGGTGENNLLIAGRIQVNFLDPEEGFFASDTYFGEKTLLCVGIAGQWQAKVAGNPGVDDRDLGIMNLDVLFERKFKEVADITFTVEAEVFLSDTGGYTTAAGYTGEGYLLQVAALWPEKIGLGKLQPFFRYQAISDVGGKVVGSSAHNTITRMDFGVNYWMSGYNAKAVLIYSATTNPAANPNHAEINSILIGAQVQF